MRFIIVGWRPKSKEEIKELRKLKKKDRKPGDSVKESFDIEISIPETSIGFTPTRITGIPGVEPFLVRFNALRKIVKAHAIMTDQPDPCP